MLSLKDQVLTEFLPGYVGNATTPASAPQSPKWTGADSLFAFWIGINDVGNSYSKGAEESTALYAKIFVVYEDLVVRLYDAGARNFLFLNVPPVDRSPLTIGIGSTAREIEKAAIAQFNNMTEGLARRLKANHTAETNVFLYDTNKAFSEVLDKVDSYPQTAMLKNTTAYCKEYEKYAATTMLISPSIASGDEALTFATAALQPRIPSRRHAACLLTNTSGSTACIQHLPYMRW